MKQRATIIVAWLHRWLGVATCLLLAMWFASGIVLLFVPFPALPPKEQVRLMQSVPTARIAIAPATAVRAVPDAQGIRLIARAGRPVYVIDARHRTTIIDATTGAVLRKLGAAAAGWDARRRFGATASIAGPAFDHDQWVVHNRFDPYRPFYRIDLNDEEGQQFYQSARTGEIVQRTDRRQRFWNWPGAVVHWLYLTPLRANYAAWDRTVWWVSLVAAAGVTTGLVIGVVRTMAVRRTRRPGLTYFRQRWLRWHHLLGLFAGAFAFTWIVSGWLSMDHGRLFSRGIPDDTEVSDYAGLPLDRAAASLPPARLREAGDAAQLRIFAIGGRPFLAATRTNGDRDLLDVRGAPVSARALDAQVRLGLAAAGFGTALGPGQPVRPDDIYTLAEGWPPGTTRYAGATGPALYVDADHILTVMNTSRAAYAWAYYALHTFNFPGLTRRPALRRGVIVVPLLAGLLLSLTGVVIGWSRLRRALR
ncbi:PepSY domain-containing protein [Sphingomonas sp.]|uniref:PepSY domain-containing protein n=1 Tax=Sphingomonas sp. TaxID=28214 RepID=UPI00257E1010|nr:PepSY domain-containing protein [Sphingomonas sp.]